MRISKIPTLLALLFGVMLLGISPAGAADAVLDQARQMMANRNAKAAFDLLSPLEAQRAGDPEFDYALGIAALDSGNPTRAIFALERVLAVNPNHPQARAEIARAYFTVGETQTAKREFQAVQRQKPPAEVSAIIDKFLEAIDRASASDRPQLRGYLEVAVGHDTNVNAATGSSQIAIPAFGGGLSTLSPAGVKASDYFTTLAGGVSFRYPLTPGLAAVGGISAAQRLNWSEKNFDTGSYGGNVGVVLTRGDNTYTAAVQAESFQVDYSRFREAVGGVVQWQHNIGSNSQASAYAQFTELRYPGQDQRNANRYVGGVAYARALGGSYEPVAYAGLYIGTEDERQAGVPYFGHDLYGVRAGGQISVNSKTVAFAGASYEQREYGGPDPFFLVSRTDKQANFSVGVNYVPYKSWTVTPQLAFTRNNSNIVINDYERTIISISVRRDFE